jgi:hypothetical protein
MGFSHMTICIWGQNANLQPMIYIALHCWIINLHFLNTECL